MNSEERKYQVRHVLTLIFFLVHLSFCMSEANGELIDRVVAFVDDTAITLTELRETYEKTRKVQPHIAMPEVLNTMVNRCLVLNDARRLKIEAKTDDELFAEYVELKVKTVIRIKEEEIADYYKKNDQEFKGAAYESVRDKIEEYLTEREINRLLKKQIAGLREKAYVKILMKDFPL